jgi:hypothetical protein
VTEINYIPTPPQSRVWDAWDDEDSTSILTGGGVNAGKTYNLCALGTIKAIMYSETRYLMGRKKLTTLMGATVKTLWKVFKDFGLVADIHYTYNGQSRTVRFFNGSEIIFDHLMFEPSDPEISRLGGLELTAALLDEVADCDYRVIEKVHERVGRCNNDKYGIKPIVIMTCNPSRGWLKKKYYDLFKKGILPAWMKVLLSTVRDNPHAPDWYIKNLSNILTPTERARQLEGSWEFGDDPDQLTTYEAAEAMYYHPIKLEDLKGVKYITADIAFSSDKCVIGVWNDWTLIQVRVVKDHEKPEDVIRELQLKYGVSGKHVAYDSTGAGYYLKNYVKGAYAFHAGAKPLKDSKLKTFEHLKTQMYCHLADKINDGTAKVFSNESTESVREELLEEMTMIQSIPKELIDSVVKLISKDKIKQKIGRSPDLLDMVSMRGVFDFKRDWQRNF